MAETIQGGIRTGRCGDGRYLVNATVAAASAVESFIREGAFASLDDGCRRPTHNRMHRVYDFVLPGTERPVILKVAWCSPEYAWVRRLEIALSLAFRDRAGRALVRALALDALGIATPTPLAAWWQGQGLGRERFFLAEKVPHDGSLMDLLKGRLDGGRGPGSETWEVIAGYARILARMHAAGLRHMDPAPGNLLVRRMPDDPKKRVLYMIDTDSIVMHRVATRSRAGRRILDLRSLKRLARHLDTEQRAWFLDHYLGSEDAPVWRSWFEFWRRHGHRGLGTTIRSFLPGNRID